MKIKNKFLQSQMSHKAVMKTLKEISKTYDIQPEKLMDIWKKFSEKYPLILADNESEKIDFPEKKKKEDTVSVTSASSSGSTKPKDFDSKNGCKFILLKKRPGECCGAKVKENGRCARHLSMEQAPPKPKNVPVQKKVNNVMKFRQSKFPQYFVNLSTSYAIRKDDTSQKVVGKIINDKFQSLDEKDSIELQQLNLAFDLNYQHQD